MPDDFDVLARRVTVRNAAWHHENVVLLGDAAHTAHFSIGSGTKLALEDAIGLAWALREHPGDLGAALAAYEADRRPIVESTQRAAQGSLEWFEGIARYVAQPPVLFAFNLLTRSRRITYGELQLRDPGFVEEVDAAFGAVRPPADVHAVPPARAGAAPTAWSSRRWTCTPRATARPATSTSSTSAPAGSAAPGSS